MSHERTVYYTCHDTRSWKRMAIGLPILVGGALALALVGWLCLGCPAATAPSQWMHQPLMLFYLGYVGGISSAVALTVLWFMGLLAFGIGDFVSAKSGCLRD